ncbi:MAG: hypothetical protein V4727_05610 [Verrucomicrobiota bacterium]
MKATITLILTFLIASVGAEEKSTPDKGRLNNEESQSFLKQQTENDSAKLAANKATTTVQSEQIDPNAEAKKREIWRRQEINAQAWALVKKEFPEFVETKEAKAYTIKWMLEWDEQAKIHDPELAKNPARPIIYARSYAVQLAQQQAAALAAQQQYDAAYDNNTQINQAPVWERFVTNSVARQHNQQNVADEIRRTDGDAAADQFLRQQRLIKEEQARVNAEEQASNTNQKRSITTQKLSPTSYVQQGDRITFNGNLKGGYRIRDNKLFDNDTGKLTHIRSGDLWMPVDSSHPQLRNP